LVFISFTNFDFHRKVVQNNSS